MSFGFVRVWVWYRPKIEFKCKGLSSEEGVGLLLADFRSADVFRRCLVTKVIVGDSLTILPDEFIRATVKTLLRDTFSSLSTQGFLRNITTELN